MPEQNTVTILLNQRTVTVTQGTSVCAALLSAETPCRISVSGEPRIALCGIGFCFECRAVVDGVPHQRTCLLPCRDGMRVETQS